MVQQAVILGPSEAKKLTLAGQPLLVLIGKEDTKHTSMFDWTLPSGFSTGLHVHNVQEETFYVLDGECDWQIGDRHVKARSGAYVLIPPGVPHNIGNSSGALARMIMTVSPPGHENYFVELSELVGQGNPPDPKAIGDLRSRYDTEQISALRA